LLERRFNVKFDSLVAHVADHSFWLSYLSRAFEPSSAIGLHLAIFAEPFLSLVLNGRKTVESRFSRVRCAPFDLVSEGDVILLKQVGGPICGLVLAKRAWFYELDKQVLAGIRKTYDSTICADDEFWRSRRNASYATLIELAEPTAIPATPCDKRDRRGWVTLRLRQLPLGV
jgi:hypothetical protein